MRGFELIGDESEMVERSLYPLLPIIGPRHGKAVGAIMAGARSGEWQLRDDGTVEVGGVVLQPDEFELTARARPGHEVAEEGDLLVALDTDARRRARGGGPGTRGGASAPGAAPERGLRDQRPRARTRSG